MSSTILEKTRRLAGVAAGAAGTLAAITQPGLQFESPAPAHQDLERRKAQRLLQLLDVHEDLGLRSDTAPDGLLRSAFARRYWEILGIDPSWRQDLRAALHDRSEATVQDILERFDIATQDVKGVV